METLESNRINSGHANNRINSGHADKRSGSLRHAVGEIVVSNWQTALSITVFVVATGACQISSWYVLSGTLIVTTCISDIDRFKFSLDYHIASCYLPTCRLWHYLHATRMCGYCKNERLFMLTFLSLLDTESTFESFTLVNVAVTDLMWGENCAVIFRYKL